MAEGLAAHDTAVAERHDGAGRAGAAARRFMSGSSGDGRRRMNRRYSTIVTVLKFGLLAIAVGLLLAVALWPEFNRSDQSPLRVLDIEVDEDAGQAIMLGPRLQGTDERSQRYSLRATTATQDDQKAGWVGLDRPNGDLHMRDGTWMYVNSDTGLFDRNTEVLDLFGTVRLMHDDGHVVVTPTARLYLDRSEAIGEMPVEGESKVGTLISEGFEIRDGGDIIDFTGQARMLIHSTSAPAASEVGG